MVGVIVLEVVGCTTEFPDGGGEDRPIGEYCPQLPYGCR